MSRIKGKKFTVAQLNLINATDPSINTNDYLYHSTESIDDAGHKCAAKNSSKTRYMNIIHRETGEIKKIAI